MLGILIGVYNPKSKIEKCSLKRDICHGIVINNRYGAIIC